MVSHGIILFPPIVAINFEIRSSFLSVLLFTWGSLLNYFENQLTLFLIGMLCKCQTYSRDSIELIFLCSFSQICTYTREREKEEWGEKITASDNNRL